MSSPGTYADTWRRLLEVISAAVKLRVDGPAPLILSSLPHLPTDIAADQPFSFIQGPPGRNIAIAMGLRAALPDVPILLIMNSDAITLGTNHLNHAARRNVQMTLLLLRSDLTGTAENESLDRLGWGSLGFQESIEGAATLWSGQRLWKLPWLREAISTTRKAWPASLTKPLIRRVFR